MPMRHFILLAVISASPAAAWEFTDQPTCTVTDFGTPTAFEMTFDGSQYTLTLTHPEGWPPGPVFGISFAPNGPLIQTQEHQINGTTLTVSDSGFENVLRGLENNIAASAMVGDVSRDFDLTDAADAVQAFRDCWPTVPTT